ncbi:MAG: hypothetical protein AB9897_01480 [Anaerolineaceae bacterium]
MPVELSEVLLEAARLDLYKINAFRVMELPIDATPRELAKRQQIVEMAMNTNYPIPSGNGRALPLPGSNDSNVLREAIQRLRDPERRLVDEFFWFWPHQLNQSASDIALQALAKDNVDGARDLWLTQEREQSEANISVHNLAVFYHLKAIDLELKMEKSNLSREEVQQRDDYWKQAYRRWKTLLEYDNYWNQLTKRIRDLDDPRLTTGMARRMRSTLPLTILLFNALLAVRAAERGVNPDAQRHIQLMKESGFAQEEIEEAIRRALNPTREMIKSLIQTADNDSRANNEKAGDVSLWLLAQVKPCLGVIDSLLPPGHPTRDSLHDDIAQQLLSCQITFVNKTENYEKSLKTLKLILPIAVGQTIRSRLEENIRIISTNLEFDTCFFCHTNKGDKTAAIEVKMHGEVKRIPFYEFGRSGTRVEWMKRTITVPRCLDCKKEHDKANSATTIGAVLGLVTGMAGCIGLISNSSDSTCGGFFVLLIGVGIGAGIGSLIGKARSKKDTKPLSAQNDFPAIKELKAKGWELGEKPAGVQ